MLEIHHNGRQQKLRTQTVVLRKLDLLTNHPFQTRSQKSRFQPISSRSHRLHRPVRLDIGRQQSSGICSSTEKIRQRTNRIRSVDGPISIAGSFFELPYFRGEYQEFRIFIPRQHRRFV